MTEKLATRETATAKRPSFCAFCAMGNHRYCYNPTGTCACASRSHDPDVETAAAMRLYQAPDLAGARLPVEALATQYRRATERRTR